ncbi:hypothetical protein BH10ACT2_BH10ACT2_23750 [soil metagenome]
MKRFFGLAVGLGLVFVAACSSESSSNASTTSTIESTDSSATLPTVLDSTTSPTTAVDVTSTTEMCAPAGDVEPKGDPDPLTLSGMVGVDIRTGAHPCYERIVIEVDGQGNFPGWAVEYVEDPVRLGESDEFTEIAGDATLSVRMGMWMATMEGDGYTGPIDIFPVGVSHILELRETENFEGMCIWSIGLDAQYPFTATVLHDPERLVIDVQIAP